MKILELFSGTECLSNAFRAKGHQCFTVDWDTRFPSSLHTDIMQLTAERILITYCQYGFTYRKATDIWTNHPQPEFLPPCRNGDPCHQPAPRGTRQGLQGIQDRALRSAYPPKLCEHIVSICERY